MAGYYTRIYVKRMANLLDLTEAVKTTSAAPVKLLPEVSLVLFYVYFNQETEEFLSNLVVNKTVQAKVDRLEGIVYFRKQQDPTEVLNEWSSNITSLMQLVSKATHLITKEQIVHHLH